MPGEGFKCYDELCQIDIEQRIGLGRIFEMSEIFQIYEFVARCRGIGFTAKNHIGLSVFAHNPSVVARPVKGLTWGFGLERLPTHALDEAEQAFWNWYISYTDKMCEQASQGEWPFLKLA